MVVLFAASAGLDAAVRMVVKPDGSTHIFNDQRGQGRVRPRPPVSRPTSRELDSLVARQAERQRLDTELVRAVIRVESDFDVGALSHKGAMGLMQLMPATAVELAVENPYDPEQNLRGGTRYLRRMLDIFDGRLELALAAYNAGPEAVRRFGGIPPYPETQSYVEKVMRIYRGDPDYRLAGSRHLRPGRKTFLYRDSTGRLLMTTSAPGSR